MQVALKVILTFYLELNMCKHQCGDKHRWRLRFLIQIEFLFRLLGKKVKLSISKLLYGAVYDKVLHRQSYFADNLGIIVKNSSCV